MEISPACKRTLATWPRFSVELERHVRRLASEGFIVTDVEVAPIKNEQRFVQVFSKTGWRCWWQKIGTP